MKILVVGPGPVRPGAPSANVAGSIARALTEAGHDVLGLDSAVASSLERRFTGPVDDAAIARIKGRESFDTVAIDAAGRVSFREGPWLGASPEQLAFVAPGGARAGGHPFPHEAATRPRAPG